MFDIVPLESYTGLQYYVLLGIALLILINSFVFDVKNQGSLMFFDYFGAFFVCIYVLYMGSRPISGRYFGDTSTYAKAYSVLQKGGDVVIEKDYVFNYFMSLCSKVMDVHTFFLLIDVIYVLPFILFSRKYCGKYWFFALFMFIGSMSTWAYGTNGLRNGIATSLFILGLCFYNKKIWMWFCFILGYFMHASLIIPIAGFIVTGLYKNPKIYIYIWIVAIPLSLAGGSTWNTFFSSLGFAEDRSQSYLEGGEEVMKQFSRTGFRWDFLLYSATPILTGWYFIYKKEIKDNFYIHLFGVYCIANAFWILVITAAFSNRFAYLSWFLMAPVIAYPMLRFKMWKDQYKTFGIILFLYFMFTFIMTSK